jgi:hypothetical protein
MDEVVAGDVATGRQTGRRSAASVRSGRGQPSSSVVEAVTEVVRQQETFVHVCYCCKYTRCGRFKFREQVNLSTPKND